MDNKTIAEIIEQGNGDGFAEGDYDVGWHNAIENIAEKFADAIAMESNSFLSFNRKAFMNACGL